MSEAVMFEPCAAAESPSRRGLRYAAGTLLVLFALAQCAMGCLMVAAQRGTPQVLYLLCSLVLFASSTIALRERRRALVAVRVSAIAAAMMLFWSISVNVAPGVTMRGHLYDLTPVFAGMLLAAVLLPGVLRERDDQAACNCQ